MTDQPQQTNPNDHRYCPEDEIELMDYLLVIWKWKYLILAGTFAFALTVVIIGFIAWKQQPTMYRTNIVLKPGVLKIDETGNKVFIDSPQNIETFITNDLKYKILDDIKSSNSKNTSTALDFQVDMPKGSDIINVSLESVSPDEDTGKLNYLIKALMSEYAYKYEINYLNLIEQRKTLLGQLKEKEIMARKEIENSLKLKKHSIENSLKLKKHEIDELSLEEKRIKAKIEKYQRSLSVIESNLKLLSESKNIAQSKEYLLNKLSVENNYLNTFQSYFEGNENARHNLIRIQNKLTELPKEITNLEKANVSDQTDSFLQPELHKIQKDIIKIAKEIEQLGKEKQNIQNIQIIQPPITNEIPKNETKIKRRIILATAVGVFLSVFLAFFLEYLSKFKDRKDR